MTETKWVVCNKERTKFFRQGEFYTEDIFLAIHFVTAERAEYWRDRAFSGFQRKLLADVVPIRITIEIDPEKRHSFYRDGNLYTPV